MRLKNISEQSGLIRYFLIFFIKIRLLNQLFSKFNRLICKMKKMLAYLKIIVELFRYLD